MVNNVTTGIKKSQFTADAEIPSGSYFDFVINGQNYRISDADFYAALGVTGSIAQDGDPTGSPVLDQQGAVNLIRNIVGGFGIGVGIDAQNSITINTDFSFNDSGATLVDDPTSDAPDFRSLVAGSSISLSESTGEILISADTDGLKPANRIIINQASDFPAAVAGRIPLSDGYEYYIGSNVVVSSPFSLTGNVVFSGQPYISVLSYAGPDSLFYGLDNDNLIIKNIFFNAPSSALLEISNTSPSTIINIINCSGTLDSLGSCEDIIGIVFSLCGFTLATDGYTEGGATTSVLSIDRMGIVSANAGFKAVDLGVNVYSSLEIQNLQVTAPAGAFGISGLVSSGNVLSGQIAKVSSCEFIGGVTPLENLTSSDVRYSFSESGGIDDTFINALTSFNNNATATVIASVDTPVLVAGTWVENSASQFTSTAAGRVVYDGERSSVSDVTVSLALSPVSGTNKDMTGYIAINGVIIPSTGITARGDSGDPRTMTLMWLETLSQGDYIEIFIENNSDAVNLLVTNIIVRVK